jgi:peroxiredoxin
MVFVNFLINTEAMKQIYTLILALSFFSAAGQTLAPNFTITDTKGNTYTLYEELAKGKTVILDFFGVQCGTCQTDVALLESVWQNHANNGQNVWIWGYEVFGSSVGSVDEFITLNGGSYPVFTLNSSDSMIEKFNVTYTPTYFVICPNGYIKPAQPTLLELYLDGCATLDDPAFPARPVRSEIRNIHPVSSNTLDVYFSLGEVSEVTFELYDLLGNKITGKTRRLPGGEHKITLRPAGISKGFYLVRMSSNQKFVSAKRIMIN